MALLILPAMSGCLGGSDFVEELLNEKGIPGGLTLACLDGSTYTKLVIEVDYETGHKPESSSTDMLAERLEQVCDKPRGVEMSLRSLILGMRGHGLLRCARSRVGDKGR